MSEHSPETRVCALCGKPQEHRFRPFCSKRCADLDLGRWLNEDYSIPVHTPPEELDEDGGQPTSPESPRRH